MIRLGKRVCGVGSELGELHDDNPATYCRHQLLIRSIQGVAGVLDLDVE